MRDVMLAIALLLGLAQCTKDDDICAFDIDDTPFTNNPLPAGSDTLRILAIGNSYTQDCARYIPFILDSARIDPSRLAVCVAHIPGASLRVWWQTYSSGSAIELQRYAGTYPMRESGTLAELLHQQWDVITLQQYSYQSDRYNTFNPYLDRLRRASQQDCPNPRVCFAWNMTWNYWTQYEEHPVTADRYHDIAGAAQKVVALNGIDILIPTGTAIENAKQTSLQNGYDMTRDGTHLAYGTASYIAACTWVQRIISPVFGIDIADTRLCKEVRDGDDERRAYIESVRPDNYRLCQQCALAAIAQPFSTTHLED